MATFGEIKSRLADDFNRTDLTSQISAEILRAIKHYERTRFWFNENIAGSALVASQQNYALSSLSVSDMVFMDRLEVTVSSHKYSLKEVTWAEFTEAWRDTTTYSGAPNDYCLYADQIWVGPPPDSGYSVDISYIKNLTTLSGDSDTNAWTIHAEDLIASRAAKMVAVRTLRDEKAGLIYAQLEKDAWNALMLQNDQRLMTGKTRYRG